MPRPTLWHLLCGLAVVGVSIAHFLVGEVSLWNCMPYHIAVYGALTPFLLSYAEKHTSSPNRRMKNTAICLGLIFSQFVSIGFSFHRHHDWALCFGNWSNILIWLSKTICYGYVFYRIVLGLISYFEKYRPCKESSISLRKWFWIIVGVRLLFIILFYPCIFGFDAAVGLRTFLDSDCASCNHHPYFIQLIHALFFTLGQKIGHLSVAMATLALISTLLTSGIIVYCLSLLNRAKLSKNWILTIALLYAFLPIFPYLSINPTKDGLFAYFFLLYVLSLYEIYLSEGKCLSHWNFILLHGVSIVLLCVTRHQGIWIALVETLFLCFCYRKSLKFVIYATLPALLLSMGYTKVLLPFFDVEPGGKQEMYGTFFQHSARYLKLYPNDVTEPERLAIDQVIGCDSIVKKYVYDKTDPVKNGYLFNPWYRVAIGYPSMFRHIDHSGEAEALSNYRKAWFSMGLRHPLCYVEASMGVCYGFFYNNNRLILETEPYWAKNGAATTPPYRFAHTNTVAEIYNRNIYRIFDKPILNWPFAIAYYNWIALFLLSLLFYRKDKKGLVVFFPLLLSIMILFICPMIYGRYAYPIVMIIPLLAAYLISTRKSHEEQ